MLTVDTESPAKVLLAQTFFREESIKINPHSAKAIVKGNVYIITLNKQADQLLCYTTEVSSSKEFSSGVKLVSISMILTSCLSTINDPLTSIKEKKNESIRLQFNI